MMTLNNGLRYIRVSRDTGLEDVPCASSPSGVLFSVGIFTINVAKTTRKTESGYRSTLKDWCPSFAGSEEVAD